VINSRAPSSKPQHVIHNTYSFKNFSNSHDRNKIYELKKSSSTGTTNLKKYDTLDSSLSSNSKGEKGVQERRSRSVNLGGILDVMWQKKNKHKNKYYDRTLYL
jgi:hypothetical protein